MRAISTASGEAQNTAETPLQDALKAMEGALLCLDEGNITRAVVLLRMAIKAARQ